MNKKILCIDFDGVIHNYDSGWQGVDNIPDDPVETALAWLEYLVDSDFEVCIYSSRSREPSGIQAMRAWFIKHGLDVDVLEQLSFPTQKPPAWLTIADRAMQFEGQFPSAEWINDFTPWNKQPLAEEYKTCLDEDALAEVKAGNSLQVLGISFELDQEDLQRIERMLRYEGINPAHEDTYVPSELGEGYMRLQQRAFKLIDQFLQEKTH